MSDWREVRISELSTIDIGGTPSRAIPAFWADRPAGHAWISIADLKGKYVFETKEHITALGVRSSNVKLIPEHTTVMSFKLTVGRTAITGREMFCNEAIAIFQPKDDRLNGRWLYHALPRAAASVVTDTAVKGATLNKATMAEMTLNLPPPEEQAKIAQVLDTLDTSIHETEAIIAKLKAVKQGLLHDLLTRGITANGELRPPQAEAPHLYKESPLGWIPLEWEVAPLGELSESLVDGPFGSNLKTAHYVENPGVRVVRLQNVLAGQYDDSERAFITERHAASLVRNRVTSGDVLIASLGDASYPVGRSCCYPAGLPDAINKADCFRFRSGPRCRNEFVMLSMNCAAARKQVRGYEQGVTMKRINLGNLRRVEIALPSVPEQEMIAVRLGTIQKQIDCTSLELQKFRFEKSGLIDDLLTGRVRVTQLPAEAAQQ